MKQLLTILHAENRLSPSVLSLVKGGDGSFKSSCISNWCNLYHGNCKDNNCQINDWDCNNNVCTTDCSMVCDTHCPPNRICGQNLNPDPSCPLAV